MYRRKSKRSSTRTNLDPSQQRINKVLAAAGLGSRRDVEDLILQGRVEVDGQTVTNLATRVNPQEAKIEVDGQLLRKPKLVYYALNKPKGVLSTSDDPSGRLRVIDFVPDKHRVFSVGRLDRYSEGLMLLTNDGDLAQRLAHPRFRVQKTYFVVVAGVLTMEELAKLRKGVYLAEGVARIDGARIRKTRKTCTELEILLSEGKNREIRRILARAGHKVVLLRRLAIGSLRLAELPVGAARELTSAEVKALYASTVPKVAAAAKNADKAEKASPSEHAGHAGQVDRADKPEHEKEAAIVPTKIVTPIEADDFDDFGTGLEGDYVYDESQLSLSDDAIEFGAGEEEFDDDFVTDFESLSAGAVLDYDEDASPDISTDEGEPQPGRSGDRSFGKRSGRPRERSEGGRPRSGRPSGPRGGSRERGGDRRGDYGDRGGYQGGERGSRPAMHSSRSGERSGRPFNRDGHPGDRGGDRGGRPGSRGGQFGDRSGRPGERPSRPSFRGGRGNRDDRMSEGSGGSQSFERSEGFEQRSGERSGGFSDRSFGDRSGGRTGQRGGQYGHRSGRPGGRFGKPGGGSRDSGRFPARRPPMGQGIFQDAEREEAEGFRDESGAGPSRGGPGRGGPGRGDMGRGDAGRGGFKRKFPPRGSSEGGPRGPGRRPFGRSGGPSFDQRDGGRDGDSMGGGESGGERGSRDFGGDRSSGSRFGGGRSSGGRPGGSRQGGRPGGRPTGGRPSGRPGGSRPGGRFGGRDGGGPGRNRPGRG